jgi:hypothetical protein
VSRVGGVSRVSTISLVRRCKKVGRVIIKVGLVGFVSLEGSAFVLAHPTPSY